MYIIGAEIVSHIHFPLQQVLLAF